MAILTGTIGSRFVGFDEPNSGIGALIKEGQNTVLDFLSKISSKQTWENQYVETGSENIPGFSSINSSYANIKKADRRKIYSQHPKATVLVKKRMFSTLRSNYDVRFMNDKEKIFIRASKLIFENKCEQIAYHESLSNLKDLFDEKGFLNIDKFGDGILDSFLTLLEGSFSVLDAFGGSFRDKLASFSSDEVPVELKGLQVFAKLIDQIIRMRENDRRSRGNQFTRWIYDPLQFDTTGLGLGPGVIELNQISNFQTSIGLNRGQSSFGIEDPYRMMVITDIDIELALRQAISEKDSPKTNTTLIASHLLDAAKQLDLNLNQIRRERGVSEINFEFDDTKDQVIGIVISTGEQFTNKTISSISENESLLDRELYYALQAFQYFAEYSTFQKRSISLFQTINKEYSDIRQRLRNEFVGQAIIQQMDQVHVFMNSQTRDDTPGLVQAESISDLYSNYLNIQQDRVDISTIYAEHAQIAPDIPFALYTMFRDMSSFRGDGVQIFSGLVDSVGTSYTASTGKFTLSVSCKDNMEFLELGRVNVDPSAAQTRGMLYDPLTPFNIKTNVGSGLVSTAKLSDANSARLKYLRFTDGIRAGEHATEKNIFHDKLLGGRVLSFQHVPGLIYQWKTGIISETAEVSLSKPLNGIGPTVSELIDVQGIQTYENVFSGLDSADIVSILITGRPYNYSSFFRQSLSSGTFSVDSTNQGRPYFNYIFDFLERQQLVKGNFIPAISSAIDPSVALEAFKFKSTLDGLNQQLLTAQRRLVELSINKVPGTIEEETQLKQKIKDDQKKIGEQFSADTERLASMSDPDKGIASLGSVGNDFYVSFSQKDLTDFQSSLKYKLKKKPEDVRYNNDQNYLIVSQQYDSDTDIQAFARNIRGANPQLFNSQYKSASELCRQAADAVGFELFADSQGNIIFRPPEYNKTPLTLLLKLISLRRTEGVSYAPDFLTDLFQTREQLIADQIKFVELQILEKVILMGGPPNTGSLGSLQLAGSSILAFSISEFAGTYFQDRDKLLQIAKATSLFNFKDQQSLLNNTDKQPVEVSAQSLIIVRDAICDINGQTYKKKSINVPADLDAAITDIKNQTDVPDAQLNKLNLINDIAKLVSERQLLLRSYASIAGNLKTFSSSDGNTTPYDLPIPSSVAAQLTGTLGGQNPVFPKFMEALIENDITNEDGWRSGKRFIIEDDVIITANLETTTPEFNSVNVVGNQDFLRTSDGSLGAVPNVLWAGAVDYDSWRKFGLKENSQQIFRADFTNAETQCAPYALFKLLEQRAKIHAGEITIMGNEFYQVGDVVYLNMSSMLYYVTNVSHSFDFSSGAFTTSLKLQYGRALGEYIPTTLDIIGKGMIAEARKAIGSIKAVRTSVPTNHAVLLDTFHFTGYNHLSKEDVESISPDSRGDKFIKLKSNTDKATKIIESVRAQINSTKKGKSRVEIRTYWLDAGLEAGILRKRALALGKWVKMLLIGANTGDSAILENFVVKQIQPIDISPEKELTDRDKVFMRYPSGQAWSAETPYTDKDGVGLPLNAIDVFFVAENSRYSDVDSESFTEDVV